AGDEGVIPGSMATGTYIVRGRGNPESYESSAHGAGRRHSRRQAKKRFTVEGLEKHMAGKAWNRDRARALLDEIPDAYKDVDSVMDAQRDLVEIEHALRQVLNYEGASPRGRRVRAWPAQVDADALAQLAEQGGCRRVRPAGEDRAREVVERFECLGRVQVGVERAPDARRERPRVGPVGPLCRCEQAVQERGALVEVGVVPFEPGRGVVGA